MQRFSDDKALGRYLADRIADIVRAKPDALISIAAGTSSFPLFDALKAKVRAGEISFAQATFFGMDEWCGLPQDADGAMADFLHRHFLDEVTLRRYFSSTARPIPRRNAPEGRRTSPPAASLT